MLQIPKLNNLYSVKIISSIEICYENIIISCRDKIIDENKKKRKE